MAWSFVDKSLILQCICFMIIVATALATVISMSLAKSSFQGLCGPYAEASCTIPRASHSDMSKRQIRFSSNETAFTPKPSVKSNRPVTRPNINKNTLDTSHNSSKTKRPIKKPHFFQTINYSQKITSRHSTPISTSKPKIILKTKSRPTQTSITSATTNTSLSVRTGEFSVCNSILVINVVLNVLYAGFCAVYHGYRARQSALTIRVGYEMWTKVWLIFSGICFLFTMITACMLTVGLSHFCQSIMMALENCELPHSQCSFSQFNKWKWNDIVIKPMLFHDFLQVTEMTNWLNVGFWMIQTALYVYRLFKQRKTKTGYQDPFVTDLSESFS